MNVCDSGLIGQSAIGRDGKSLPRFQRGPLPFTKPRAATPSGRLRTEVFEEVKADTDFDT